jgi:hypothetical protein
VRHDNGAGPLRNSFRDLFRPHVVTAGQGVRADRDAVEQRHRHDTAHIGNRRHNDFGEGLEFERAQGNIDRRRAGIDGIGITAAEKFRELPAIRLFIRAVITERLARINGVVEKRQGRTFIFFRKKMARGPGRCPDRRAAINCQGITVVQHVLIHSP